MENLTKKKNTIIPTSIKNQKIPPVPTTVILPEFRPKHNPFDPNPSNSRRSSLSYSEHDSEHDRPPYQYWKVQHNERA